MDQKRGPSLWELRNKKPVQLPKPDAAAIAARPHLQAEPNRSHIAAAQTWRGHVENREVDEFDAQHDWQARIDAGLIKVTR